MEDLIILAVACAVSVFVGYRIPRGKEPEIVTVDHYVPIGDPKDAHVGHCLVREFAYDGSDGNRRMIEVHSACDAVSFRDPLRVAAAADKKIKPLTPGGVSQKLVVVRDSEHEAV